MGFATEVSNRFLRSRGSRLLSLITFFAGLGIVIGVMVLDVTLAVMNGFRDQIQLKFVENMPMVTIMRQRGFVDLDAILERLREDPDVLGAAPFIRSEAVVTFERLPGRPLSRGVVLWGVDPQAQREVTRLFEQVEPPIEDFSTEGLLGAEKAIPGVVLGSELAGGLRALVGDVVALHAPRKVGPGPTDYESRTVELMVVGILDSGMYEFDSAFAYVDLSVAQELFERPGGADGIGLRVRDMMRAPEVADRLEQELGYPPYFANDWIRLNRQLFEWIRYEKALMFLLLTFLILIATFNVVAILIMMVRDRRRDIGILLALGTRRTQLVRIFLRLGMTIGWVGTVVGTGLGYAITVLLDRVGVRLPGDVLFVDRLPVHARVEDFLLVGGTALVLTFVVTLLPTWLATRLTPVEVLRHE